jgi:hypothetical protein
MLCPIPSIRRICRESLSAYSCAVPDGSRLFVVDEKSIRLVDLRPGSPTAGVTTVCKGLPTSPASMCWLSSERLLIGDRAGAIHCFDLLNGESHVVSQLPAVLPDRDPDDDPPNLGVYW